LPGLRHGFKSAAAKALGIYRHAAPTENAQTFLFGSGFDGALCCGRGVGWKKGEAETELFGQFDSLLGGFAFEEFFG